ncbi:MAG TPA: universal stress protein [Gaiellaceae bacterium]|nr:universal stress protein [Gaiellaceae bacterium]
MGTVVVGVDGSEGAQEALRFAASEARLRGDRLRVVTVWHVPTIAYSGGLGPAVGFSEFDEDARARLGAALEAAGDEVAGLEVERVVREGQPALELVEEARDADLLVVGSRGHGGFVGLLLGSVGQQCAQHAPCPVVIVHKHGGSARS